MNGREVILILAHLFRTKGNQICVDDAVRFLSFKCRYGKPSNIRRLLSVALNNEMISRNGNQIVAEFKYNLQTLSPNQSARLHRHVNFKDAVKQMV
ncbi:MAG: hypothetical protein ACXABV_04670 [Candidatus Thorarchaeota archaeon]|jgi:hypothetical protein